MSDWSRWEVTWSLEYAFHNHVEVVNRCFVFHRAFLLTKEKNFKERRGGFLLDQFVEKVCDWFQSMRFLIAVIDLEVNVFLLVQFRDEYYSLINRENSDTKIENCYLPSNNLFSSLLDLLETTCTRLASLLTKKQSMILTGKTRSI